ncbi:MAG: gamma carbonic anhydrase family protein, partial [Acidobacteriota bacterium]|nr:gamma carbonic anhydrase family protein [Acidobacteriota bacterium]
MNRKYRDTEPKIHKSAFVAENAVIIGDVEIGEGSGVWYGCVLRGDVNFIKIGRNTNIQDMTMIHVSRHDYPTIVDDEVTVGHKVTLHGCHIESNSLIG